MTCREGDGARVRCAIRIALASALAVSVPMLSSDEVELIVEMQRVTAADGRTPPPIAALSGPAAVFPARRGPSGTGVPDRAAARRCR